MAKISDPPQHHVWCEAGTAEFVSGRNSRWWWRCPTCQWVGWFTSKRTTVPIIGRHSVPAPPKPDPFAAAAREIASVVDEHRDTR